MLLLALAACDDINQIKDTIEGYTQPVVVQALLLGAEEPDLSAYDIPEGMEVDTSAVAGAAAVEAFLADASSVDDLDNAPLAGIPVRLRVGDTPAIELEDQGSGAYGSDAFEYVDKAEAALTFERDGVTGKVSVELPYAPDLDIEFQHEQGAPLILDLTPFDYEAVLAVVFDTQTGELVYSNEPEDIVELYEWTRGDAAVKRMEIPGKTFAFESIYAVGVAGMVTGDPSTFEEVNTALSSFMAGKASFYLVSTLSVPTKP